MKKIKAVLAGSLIVNILFIGIAGFLLYKQGGLAFVAEQTQNAASSHKFSDYYLQRKDIFESLETVGPDKVFVGDSITDHGEFQEYFPGEVVLNRGISEDTSEGVLNRIDEVAKRNPKEVYVMVGINDIGAGVDGEKYRENVEKIIKSFDQNSTEIILQSILPINNRDFTNELSNDKVHEFNGILQKLAKEYHIGFVDLHPAFEGPDGQLKKDLTVDGIHLNSEGYLIWMNQLHQL